MKRILWIVMVAALAATDMLGWQFSEIAKGEALSTDAGEHYAVSTSDGNIHIFYGGDHLYHLEYHFWTQEWTHETVDASDLVGCFATAVAGANDTLHVAYYDDVNKRYKYATNASGSWKSYRVAESETAAAPAIVVFASGSAGVYFQNGSDVWQANLEVPSQPQIGLFLSNARNLSADIDENGTFHTVHTNTDATTIYYRRNVQGIWSSPVSAVSLQDGATVKKLAFDAYMNEGSGKKALCYYVDDPGGIDQTYVAYTAIDDMNSDWNRVNIGTNHAYAYQPAVYITSNGTVTAGFWDGNQIAKLWYDDGNQAATESVKWTSTGNLSLVYSSTLAMIHGGALPSVIEVTGGFGSNHVTMTARNVPRFLSAEVAVGSDNVPQAVFDRSGTILYARKEAAQWNFETVRESVGEPEIALKSNNVPYVLFYDCQKLRLQNRIELCGENGCQGGWIDSFDVPDPEDQPGIIDSGIFSAHDMAVDSHDNLHVCYTHYNSQTGVTTLYYAHRDVFGWEIRDEVATGIESWHCDIHVDAADQPHIMYDVNTYGSSGIYHASKESGIWVSENIESGTARNTPIALSDASGHVHAAYYGGVGGGMYYTQSSDFGVGTPRSWPASGAVVGSSASTQKEFDMLIDSGNRANIYYMPEAGVFSQLRQNANGTFSTQQTAVAYGVSQLSAAASKKGIYVIGLDVERQQVFEGFRSNGLHASVLMYLLQ